MTKRKNLKKKNKNKKCENVQSAEKPLEASNVESQENSELIEKLLNEAESDVNTFNYETAQETCNKVLQLDPNNIKGLEMLASIYIELVEWDEAESLLLRCVDMSPNEGYAKYFSLGQLYEGKKSIECYQKGIRLIEQLMEKTESDEHVKDFSNSAPLKRILSDAYCSIAELYMTDCCFEENAENKCKTAIEKSIEIDSTNPEAYQCLANLHLIKEEFEEAKSMIDKSLSFWLSTHEALRDGSDVNPDSEIAVPLFDSRVKTSKILIELEMYDEATKVLEGLIENDDEVTEVWYLLGWLNYLRGEDYKGNARYYFKKAKEVASKTGMADPDQMAHIEELMNELSGYATDEDDDDVTQDNIEDLDGSSLEESENEMES